MKLVRITVNDVALRNVSDAQKDFGYRMENAILNVKQDFIIHKIIRVKVRINHGSLFI